MNIIFKLNNPSAYNTVAMEADIHSLHNYIRNNTKISNEDKSFFIACILLALKNDAFKSIIENYPSQENIYSLIANALKQYQIDISVFKSLQSDKNNKHFLHIINIVNSIYDKNPGEDLLNTFYSEFVKYSNTDGKSLGIVLTPAHIIDLMIHMLDLTKDDIFLDLCSGTGSFAIEASKYGVAKCISVEYQTKLHALLKCNMLLHDINAETINDDCFNHNFVATKSAINPPYGIKNSQSNGYELDFVIKQLESCSDKVCAILPRSKLNSNVQNNKLKRRIMQLGKVETIIICNPKLFYPVASVEVCIILIKRYDDDNNKKIKESYNINIIDYSDDGIERIVNKGSVRTEQFYTKYKDVCNALQGEKRYKLRLESDWSYLHMNSVATINASIDITELELRVLKEEYNARKRQLLENRKELQIPNAKAFKIGELFDVLKRPKTAFKDVGKLVNLCAALNRDNGVKMKKEADKNTFAGNNILLVVGGDGGAGLAFYQNSPFMITSSTAVLAPAPNSIILDEKIGTIIALQLSKYKAKYSRTYQWNIQRIKNDILYLPYKEGKIDYCAIYELYDILKNRF